MRATPLMLAVALALGLPASAGAVSPVGQGTTDVAMPDWIVVFDEPAAATFRGFDADSRRPKLAATSPAATGAGRYDARSTEARAYLGYLADLRGSRMADISARLGRQVADDVGEQRRDRGIGVDHVPVPVERDGRVGFVALEH